MFVECNKSQGMRRHIMCLVAHNHIRLLDLHEYKHKYSLHKCVSSKDSHICIYINLTVCADERGSAGAVEGCEREDADAPQPQQ